MRKTLELALQAFGAVGAVLYGLGWLCAARFYGRFGLMPEEAGVSFSFVVVRVVLALLVVAGCAAAAVAATGRGDAVHGLLSAPRLQLRARLFLLLLLVTEAVMFIGFVGITFWQGWWRAVLPALASTLGLVALVVAVATVAVRITNFKAEAQTVEVRRPVLTSLLMSVLVAAVLAATLQLGHTAADRVVRGEEISLPGFRVMRVAVTWVGPAGGRTNSLDGRCVAIVGKNDGLLLLFDAGQDALLRVDAQNVVLSRGRSACVEAGRGT